MFFSFSISNKSILRKIQEKERTEFMIIQDYKLEKNGELYDVTLYLKVSNALEEFAKEFGNPTRETEKDINRLAIGYVRSKLSSIKVRSIKIMMGGVLVTTIMISGNMTRAFAHEHETTHTETTPETTTDTTTSDGPTDTTETTIDTTTDTNPLEEEPVTEPTPEEPVTEETTEEVPMDEPGLVPGDFFYFVDIIAEKVLLALTFDDTAKAERISAFANERIAEANALFEEGDTVGAIDLLNNALESQELVLDYITEEEGPVETTTEEDEATPEGHLPPEETDGETVPTEEEAAEENPASEVRDELQTQFSQNIRALLLAMEKVENPKAKAALAKNVEKVFAKMEKRLGKMKDIEERISRAIPVDEDVEDLRKDLESDREDFKNDMEEVESSGVVPAIVPKNAQDKAQKGTEKAPSEQQKGQEKAGQDSGKATKGTEKASKGQEKATHGKQIGQEKQNEKRADPPAPKNEVKEERTNKGNANAGTNAGRDAGNKGKEETKVNGNVEAGTEVKPAPKGNERGKRNEGNGNQGKGNGKNNE